MFGFIYLFIYLLPVKDGELLKGIASIYSCNARCVSLSVPLLPQRTKRIRIFISSQLCLITVVSHHCCFPSGTNNEPIMCVRGRWTKPVLRCGVECTSSPVLDPQYSSTPIPKTVSFLALCQLELFPLWADSNTRS